MGVWERSFLNGATRPILNPGVFFSVPCVTGSVMRITAPLLVAIAKLISGASVRWVDCEPDTCQRVYFANHTSHLDALLLWASLPAEIRYLTRPVAAKDYWERGAIRRYIARQFNALLIDRKEIKVHRSPVQIMLNAIGDTDSLIVFPEGGRSTSTELGEFKSGLFHLSKKKPELELIPVYIENLNRVLPRGEFLPVPLLSHLTYGPPMWLETGETKVEFLNRAREAVLRLKEIR
jgi:1-acyl-sn-glycerol-3-phosphate acyltransferase